MSLSFFMDHHVPSAITVGLRRRGVDCLTAHEDGTAEADDAALLERVTRLGRVVFSQDDDLLRIAHESLRLGHEFAGVIYAHQLRITIGQAVRDLELAAGVLSPEDMRNRVLFIPL